jgi:hypothetical protein
MTEEEIADIYIERDRRLYATDRYAVTDRVLSDAMRAYRQALRDIPQQAGFPDNVIWPEEPIE